MCAVWRSGNLAPSTAQNGHKGSSYQGGDSPAIASPARRSEVSPIQSHVSKHYSFIIVHYDTIHVLRYEHMYIFGMCMYINAGRAPRCPIDKVWS